MAELELNRGSDLTFMMNWKQPNGAAFDLGAAAVIAYEPHPKLAGHITFTVMDAAQGQVRGRIEWQADMPSGRIMTFRAGAVIGGDDTTTEKFWVTVK